MDYFKLGIINLLGIVAPGAILIGGLLLGLIGIFEYFEMTYYRIVFQKMIKSQFLISIIFLLGSYLMGSAIRLFANDFTEIFSGLYLRWIRRKKSKLAIQRFPYPIVSKWIEDNVRSEIIKYLREKNSTFDKEGNKDFYNYCKMYIRSHSSIRAELCERIESYVRFLAGSFIASMFALAISTLFSTLFFFAERYYWAISFLGIFITMLLVSIAILERFRHQHTREVLHTWMAFYDCAKEKDVLNAEHENNKA